MAEKLRFGPVGERAVHLCVDMQNMFALDTDWHTPWMQRVLPNVLEIARAKPGRTIYSRFIPAGSTDQLSGTWVRYYRHWESMRLDRLEPRMIELVDPLQALATPDDIVDKRVYSPWLEPRLDDLLRGRGCDTLVVTGGETDVCVLATVLGAVDRGYRVILATDALCSSSDEIHDATLLLYNNRYGQQIETVTTETVLRHWDR